jgi:hypothetical protein
MSTRIRPRSAIADAELARMATVDLPQVLTLRRPHTPRALLHAVATMRRTIEPERVIVMTLQPVAVEARRR